LFLATYSKLTTSQANGNIEIAKVVKDTVDFSAVIQQFINKNVTHVVMLNHHADLLRFSTQAAARNYFPTYIGSDGWGSNENVFKTLVLDSTLGSHFVGLRNNYWHEESTTRAAAAFKAGFKKKFIERPDAWSAIGYDSMLLLLSAMNRASDPTNGDLIRKSMQETRNPPLATSETFTFDTNNSPKKDLYIYKIHKYGVKFEEIIK
jgi:branched-chain amino acid transport system substrate-binding protein